MAESHGGVDAIAEVPVDEVREALRGTMVLGLPVEDSEKPTFYFDREVSWALYDREGSPWDWEATPATETGRSEVQPVCAYEFFSPLGRQGAFPTEVGDFIPTTVVVTLLEDEFAEVNGASYATFGPQPSDLTKSQRWFFRFYRPTYGLGDMTVYQIHLVAEGVS